MKLLPILALALTTAFAARADVVIEQKIESAMINGNMVMKVKGDQARMDMPSPAGPVTVLINFKTGEMTTLMSAQKMAVKMDMKMAKQAAEAQQKAAGIDPSKMEKPKATGTTEKVGDYTADVYDFTVGQMNGKIWAAKDYPNVDVLKAELKKISEATSMGFDPGKMDVPGMVVKSQVTTAAGAITTTLISAKQQDVAATEFNVPEGYTEMKMPTAPGAAPAPAK
jgi:hypothetical protein